MAAAVNLLAGRTLYSDFWFDKPPLFAYLYTLWGADPGVSLRIAGAVYVTLCAWLMARVAGHWRAGALLAFFLIFEVPSAAMVLGPDLLTLAPVLAAALLRDRPVAAGAMIAVAFHFNVKAAVFLVLVSSWQGWISFAVLAAPVLLWPGYYQQVIQWGSVYARDTFVEAPWTMGSYKTGAWLGFHAALVIAALRAKWDRWMLLWLAAALVCVVGGLRFFPRYYFHLLPPLCLAASQGWPALGRFQWAAAALLVIPFVRYLPSYWRVERSGDLAMFRDAQTAAATLTGSGGTILTWGYRPEIDAMARLPGGTPFLESQPLTCVFADRHLVSKQTNGEDAACASRRVSLTRYRPTFIVDGLGRYNPELAIARYPDLAQWMRQYKVVALTQGTIIYRIQDEVARIR